MPSNSAASAHSICFMSKTIISLTIFSLVRASIFSAFPLKNALRKISSTETPKPFAMSSIASIVKFALPFSMAIKLERESPLRSANSSCVILLSSLISAMISPILALSAKWSTLVSLSGMVHHSFAIRVI